MNSIRALLVIAALTGIATASGCGGEGDSSADPQAVLDDAFGSTGADSGVLDLDLSVESSGDQAGSISAAVQGPFQSNGTADLPSVDLDVSAKLDSGSEDFEFEGGLTIVDEGAFVGLDGTEYQLDDASFDAVKVSYQRSAEQQAAEEDQGSLAQFGVDPRSWITDLTNEGTEDLDGTEVVHVSGSADVPKMVADLQDVAQQTGQADQLDAAALGALEDSITDAAIDVYAASDDYGFRRLDIGLGLADPSGGSGEVAADLSIGLTDPGSDQEIVAPDDAQPISGLLSQIPGGAEALGLGGSAAGGAAGIAGGSPGPGVTGSAEKYYDCVAQAEDTQALDACSAQIAE